jgi:hypothetical protein
MECLWRLFCHWQPYGHSHQPYPAVFYLYLFAHHGLTDHFVYDPCIFEEYAELHDVGEKESVVLFVEHPLILRGGGRLPVAQSSLVEDSDSNWNL